MVLDHDSHTYNMVNGTVHTRKYSHGLCVVVFCYCLVQGILTHIRHRYRKVSNIRRTLVGSKIVDHSDVVRASPVGTAPTTSSGTYFDDCSLLLWNHVDGLVQERCDSRALAMELRLSSTNLLISMESHLFSPAHLLFGQIISSIYKTKPTSKLCINDQMCSEVPDWYIFCTNGSHIYKWLSCDFIVMCDIPHQM